MKMTVVNSVRLLGTKVIFAFLLPETIPIQCTSIGLAFVSKP